MTRKLLLGTTALAGLGALIVATPASAIETSVGGYARFGVVFGNEDDQRNTPNIRNFYFREEFEIHVNAKGKDDATGTEYGAQVQLETDRGSDQVRVDEQWIWLKGNWGEVRLGNEDGAAYLMRITAAEVAAGTGGIDGWPAVSPFYFHLLDPQDVSKAIYFSPNISGFQFGISYTPDTGHFGGDRPVDDNGDYENHVEAAANYTAEMGGAKFRIGAHFARANHETVGVLDYMGYGLGALVEVSGIKVAGSVTRNSFDGGQECSLTGIPGLDLCDNVRYTLGAGVSLGPANVSITGVLQNSDQGSDPRNIVLSGDVTLFPGVALQGDVAFWNLDKYGPVDVNWRDDSGVTGVVRIHVGM